MNVIEQLSSGYNKFLQWGDPRTERYILLTSPLPALTVVVLYLLFIFKTGPNLMKDRNPYNLRKTIMFYNIIQIIFNSIGVKMAFDWFPYVNFFCATIDQNDMTLPHYLYVLLKIMDLLDTVFFVLRKKYKQITFLHLYHHLVMVVGGWASFRFYPGGQLFFLGAVNCFVHVVMYIYYFLTSWDPKYKNYTWWKRHLTQLQIIQHCFIFVSFLVPLLNPNCTYSKAFSVFVLLPIALMIYLFVDFYVKAYVRKKTEAKDS